MEMISNGAPAFSVAATDRRDPQIWNNGESETPVVPAMLVQAFKKGARSALTAANDAQHTNQTETTAGRLRRQGQTTPPWGT